MKFSTLKTVQNPSQSLVQSFRRKGLFFSSFFIIPFLVYLSYDYYKYPKVEKLQSNRNYPGDNHLKLNERGVVAPKTSDLSERMDQNDLKEQWHSMELELMKDDLKRVKRFLKRDIREWKELHVLLKYISSLSQASNRDMSTEDVSSSPSPSVLNNFSILYEFLEDEESTKEEKYHTINFIRRLALEAENHLSEDRLSLLRTGNQELTLNKLEVASILAKAFFGLYTGRWDSHTYYDYKHKIVPSINMSQLFSDEDVSSKTSLRSHDSIEIDHSIQENLKRLKVEKIKFIFQYFNTLRNRVEANEGSLEALNHLPTHKLWYQFWRRRNYDETAHISLYRQVLDPHTSVEGLISEHNNFASIISISDRTTIEEDPSYIICDFTNKFVGGGVYTYGCTQDEIMFLIYPELLVARLFCPRLGWNESLTVRGAERYSNYKGYASTLSYGGAYNDTNISNGQVRSTIVAFDALKFKYSRVTEQWKKVNIDREILKAYSAFKENPLSQDFEEISTGNWGFGAFYGDPELKFILQWISASMAGRKIFYHTGLHSPLQKKITKFVSFVQKNQLSVAQLYEALVLLSHEYDTLPSDGTTNGRYPETIRELRNIIQAHIIHSKKIDGQP